MGQPATQEPFPALPISSTKMSNKLIHIFLFCFRQHSPESKREREAVIKDFNPLHKVQSRSFYWPCIEAP